MDLLFRYVPLATPRKREIAHVEVQGQRQRTFGQRMDRYRSLIRAEYDLPLSQGALLTDESRQWRPTTYREVTPGGSVEVTFTATKLLAWEGQEADLETTENEWAQVLLAFLLGRRHRRSEPRRLEAKLRITQRLLEKGLEKAELEPLVGLVDSYLPLSDPGEQEFAHQMREYEEAKAMRYVTGVERVAVRKGLEQGIEQGIERGIPQGKGMGLRVAVATNLSRRFAASREEWERQLTDVQDPVLLEQLLNLTWDAQTLEAFVEASARLRGASASSSSVNGTPAPSGKRRRQRKT